MYNIKSNHRDATPCKAQETLSQNWGQTYQWASLFLCELDSSCIRVNSFLWRSFSDLIWDSTSTFRLFSLWSSLLTSEKSSCSSSYFFWWAFTFSYRNKMHQKYEHSFYTVPMWQSQIFIYKKFLLHIYSLVILPCYTGSEWNLVSTKNYY